MDYLNKTKEELIGVLLDQKQELDSLKLLLNKGFDDRNQIEYVLNERLKELNCHNQISDVMSNADLSIDEVCEKIVQIIPPSWQFPEITHVSIHIFDKIYTSPGFKETEHFLAQEIKVDGNVIGQIEVYYSDELAPSSEPLFLPEESDLLFSIAGRIGKYLAINITGKELRENEERLRVITESALEAIILIDPNGEILYWNQAAERIIGYQKDEVLGKNLHKLIVPDRYHEAHHAAFPEFVKTGRGDVIDKTIELEARHKDGHEIIVELCISKIWIDNGWHAVGFLRDITKKKQAVESLRDSELKYRNLIERINDVIYTTDKEANITFVSPSIEKLLEYTPEEIIGKNFINFIGESSQHLLKRFEDIQVKTELQNEYLIPSKSGITHWIRFSSKAIFVDGIFQGVTGVLIDVTEKKLIELELQKSESLYRSILQASPDTIFIADLEGRVLFTSPMALIMFGYENTEFPINSPLFDFVDPKDHEKARDAIRQMFEGKYSGATEYMGVKSDGSKFDMEVNGEFIRDADGQPTRMIFVARDISDRKLAEKKLRMSESLYKSVLDASPDTITITDLTGQILFSSPKSLKMFGYDDPELIVNRSFLEFLDEKCHEKARNAIMVMLQGTLNGAEEYTGVRADGSTFEIEVNGDFIRDDDGQITSMIFVTRDISDRKVAEKKLQKIEDNYQRLVESINDIVFDVSLDGTIKYVSPSVERLFNFKADDLIGQNFFIFVHPDDQAFLIDVFKNNRFNEHNNIEYRCITQTGEIVWVQASAQFAYEEGKIIGRTGILHDITERKLAEEKLRKSEEQYRNLVESVNDVIYEIDATGIIKFVSQSVINVLGYSVEEVTGLNIFSFIYPEDVPVIMNTFKNLSTRNYSFLEYRYVQKDGSIHWVRSSTTAQIKDGVIIGATGTLTDVTDRKIAEKKLRENEELYRSIINTSPDSITITNLEGIIIFTSPQTNKMFEIDSPEDYINHHLLEFIAPSDHLKAQTNLERMFYEYLGVVEYNALKPDGTSFKIEVNADIIKDAEGRPSKIILNSRDITERIAIEEKLKKSEESFRSMVENLNDVIFEISNEGIVNYVSPSIERFLGYKPEDLIGQNFIAYIHPEDRLNIKEKLATLYTRDYSFLEYRYFAKDGSVRWVRSSTNPIIENGEMIGGRGVLIDITERKKTEDALTQSEERLKYLISSQTNYVLWTDLDGRHIYWNQKFEDEYGWMYAEEGLDGAYSLKSICGYHHQRTIETVTRCIANPGEVIKIELDKQAKDGGTRTTLWEFVCLTDANKIPNAIQCMGIDITDRKLVEQQLQQSEQKYKALFYDSPLGYLIIQDGKYIDCNKVSETLIGGNRSHIIGKTPDEISPEYQPNGKKSSEYSNELINKAIIEGNIAFEWVHKRVDETEFLARIDLSVIEYQGTNVLFISWLDISAQREAERKLRESEERFRMVFENVFDGISIIEEDVDPFKRKLIDCNEQYATMSGRSRDELLQMGSIYSLTKTLDENANTQRIQGISEKVAFHGSFKWIRPDAKDNTIEYIAMPISWHGKNYSIGIDRDITEYKQKENELRKLSQAVEQSPISIVITDLEGNIEYANPQACQTTGYTLNELKGKNPRVLKSGETPLDEYQFMWDSIANGNVWRGIFHNKRKNGELYWESSQITPITDSTGKIKNYLALKEDITERKQIQEDLFNSENRFREITEQSQNVIWETNSEAVYTFVSQASEIAWGLKPADLVGKKRFFDIHPEEGRNEFTAACLKQLSNGEQFRNLESPILGDDGKINWVLTNGMPYLDSQGNVSGYRGSSLNINQQKSAFEALRKSEDRFSQIAEQSQTIIWEIDPSGLYTYVSQLAESVWGFVPDEIIGKMHFYDLHPKAGREEYKKTALEAIHRKEHFSNLPNQIVTGDNRLIWVSTNGIPILDQYDNLIGYRGADNDITDRLVAEDALLQREQDLNFSQEIAGMGSWQINMVTNTSKWSDNMYRIFGLDPDKDKASQDLFFELIHPDDRHLIGEYMEKIFRDRKQVTFEMRLNLKSGKSIWIQNSMIPSFEGGQLITLNGTNVDITEKKLTEESLRISEAILNQAQEISKMCSWELDTIAGKLTWSKNYYHLMGIPNGAEMKNEFFMERVHPDDLHVVEENMEEMKSLKTPVIYNIRLRMPDNEYRWIQNNIVPEFENDILVRYKGVNIDVTEKKLAEESIKLQNERLSAIIGAMPDLIFVVDRNGTYLEYYSSNPDMLIVSDEQIVGTNIKEIFDENLARLHLLKIEECLQQQKLITYDFEGSGNNSNHFSEVRLAPMGAERVLTFVRDITDEKLKDNQIKKLSLAVEQSPIIVVITDLKGNIEYVNPAFTAITGYRNNEVIGKNTRILKSGETDPKLYKNLWDTINSGDDWYGEWVNKKKNGKLYWESVSITPIRDNNGKVTNYLAIKQDITQRKQTEKEIYDLNANLELKIEERTSELEKTNKNLLAEIKERIRVEGALGESEKSYRTVVENVNEVIFQTNAEGLWVFLNQSWEKVTGFSVEESLGQLFVNYVHPDDRARNWELFEPLIQRKKEYCRHEIRYLTKDGGFRWVEVFARLGINDNDEITGTYGTLQDITERKLIGEALLTKTAELEHFFAVTPDLLCIVDMTGKFVKLNNAWETTLGYPIGTIENTAFYDFVHPDDIEPTAVAMCELNEQNPIINFTNRYKAKDGSYRFIEWHSVPSGDLIFSAARDVTERKRAQDFENEMLQLSPKLTGISISEINNALNLALSRIGQFLSADRVYIFELSPDGKYLNNTVEWCNEGISPEINKQQLVPVSNLPEWMKALSDLKNIVIESVLDLPDEWSAERKLLEIQDIQSLIAIPMLFDNNLIGFVGLDSVKTKKTYNLAEINILKVWSSMLSSLINNQRHEKLIEQTRQNYETFFNTIDDFLWVLDKQGNIIHTNKTVKNRLEYSTDELINQSVLMVHPPDRREEAGQIVGEMLTGLAEFCPVPVVTKSGKHIPVETKIKPGYWNGIEVLFGVSKDISQIKISEQKFSSAFQSNSAMMAISHFESGKFLDVNNAFLETLGFGRDEIIGKTSLEFELYVDPKDRDVIRGFSQNNPIRKMEVLMHTKSGQIKTGLISADYIYIGETQCLLTVTVDITDRKKAEEEIKAARIEAEQANMAKSEFLSRMSHELRTPMNSILGFAQLLEMGELNIRQRKGVNHIMKSGKHLLDLINEVLDISRIEAGRLSLSIEPVQLGGVIAEMIDIVKLQANERQIKLELTNSLSNQLFVKADRQRLKQIVLNLLNNAIKYNKDNGLVTITAELQPINAFGSTMVRISITDTGLGIAEEDVPKLFKPFERIGAEKTGTEGTGLGLSVVKKLVEAMSGSLGVESKFEVGSTFWIEFPSSESQLENALKTGDLDRDESKLINKSGTILYIEDNASNIELVEQILTNERSGLRLITDVNGKQAIPLAIDYRPDLILLDLDLPDIHGSEVLQLLLHEELTKNIPVVVISADAMPQQINRLLKAGAKSYLTKPLDVIDFLKIVDEFMTSKN